jgi:hypothetical protein
MLKKIDFKMLLGAISALSISYLTIAGIIQNYIHFSGVENEIGFFLLSFFMGIMLMFGIKK